MKIAVLVQGSPTGSTATATAYRYVQAALSLGHTITRVFFYGEAVSVGNHLACPPQDEGNWSARWQQLAQNLQLELSIGIAAGLRRGIVNEQESARHGKSGATLSPGFELSGLGQLADAAIHADRVITFGGTE